MSFAHFTLATRDVIATCRFFCEAFGWEELPRPGNIASEAAWIAISDDHEMHLLRVDDFEVSPFEAEFGRHLALYHPADDYDGLRHRLEELGAELVAPIRETPFRRFFFRDPVNGYVFEIIEEGAVREAFEDDAVS